jgi:hypothetical protein
VLRQQKPIAWLLLVTSISGNHGALRLRFWRTLKATGAAVLRDGVYLAPAVDGVRTVFDDQANEIVASGGSAFVLNIPDLPENDAPALTALFDRSAQYEKLVDAADDFTRDIASKSEVEARRTSRQLTREFSQLEATDFFPGQAREGAKAALAAAEQALTDRFSPDEPSAVHASVPQLDMADYRERTWATRAHLWVDRVASAWLIRRFIDPGARFVWLRRPAECPASAIGFDFDGAEFTHVEERVTFEVLLRSFGLDTDEALNRIAAIVHQLDVGGGRVAEASGFEAILTGARERCASDDAFLDDVGRTLDDLYHAFAKASTARKEDS